MKTCLLSQSANSKHYKYTHPKKEKQTTCNLFPGILFWVHPELQQRLRLTEGRQHVVKVLFVHKTISILVDHVEGFFELLDLGLVKHGEDIGGGALRALLCGLSLGFLARHLDCWFLEGSEQHMLVYILHSGYYSVTTDGQLITLTYLRK